MKSRFVVNQADVPRYSPANHTGTFNQRVICGETVGACDIEILIGTIVKAEGAQAHAHPAIDQAGYILEGSGLVETDAGRRVIHGGEWASIPQGTPHRFTVLSETLRTVVVYAPPYQEDAAATVLCPEAISQSADDVAPPVLPASAVCPFGFTGATLQSVITRTPNGAQHLESFEATIEAGGGKQDDGVSLDEQVVHLLQGRLEGSINGEQFAASASDWVFIPQGAHWTLLAQERVEALIFCARGAPARTNLPN